MHDPRSAMLPLGDSWIGSCHAAPGQLWQPDESTLRMACNLGYARGSCPRFPADDAPDAVRFTISANDEASVHIDCVLERDHRPYSRGPMTYLAGTSSLDNEGLSGRPAPSTELLRRQARAYVQSYFRRKQEA